jgi:signal transduction histidine kinase
MVRPADPVPSFDRHCNAPTAVVAGGTMSTEHLRFSTEMLRRLGEELNPHPDQGILELVRNAYDADAGACTVELIDTQTPGGTIRITDDGDGMGVAEIRDGWLVIGTSTKTDQSRTKRKGRTPIGNKGIGRLAALRLGKEAVLTTRPRDEPGAENRLELDWSRFDSAKLVDEVALKVIEARRQPGVVSGTIIEIKGIRQPLGQTDVKRLARAMILLADPFTDLDQHTRVSGFRPVLKAREFEDLEKLVARRYFDEAEYHLRAELDSNGKARATVWNYGGQKIYSAPHKELCSDEDQKVYRAPPAVFDLWMYKLGKTDFSIRSATITEIRDWLREFGGVHLYHRGMRVEPYSDYDWLDLNLRRSRSPELRPSTNTSIGRVAVVDPDRQLKPKTDRIGFIEDEVFQELRRFAIDALEWLADRRLKEREQRRESEKTRTAEQVEQAKKSLETVLKRVSTGERAELEKAIDEYDQAKVDEANNLREDLQLYRTLCTVGATAATFAHQAKSALGQISSSAASLEDSLKSSRQTLFDRQTLREIAKEIRGSADSILSLSKVTLSLLQHEKRRRAAVSLHSTIEDMVSLLEPHLRLRQVQVQKELAAGHFTVLASKAALESIVVNLVINSLQGFCRTDPGERKILLRTGNVKKVIQLMVLDNGPGIEKMSVEDIWLPGKTTTQEGTGLGLTIVKDIVTELGGRVQAVAQGELGGAEFLIELPVRGG